MPLHSGTSGASVGYASSCFLLARPTPFDHLGFDLTGANSSLLGERFNDANGDWIKFRTELASGQYDLVLGIWIHTGGGIITLSIDSGEGFVNIDQAPYNAASATFDTYTLGSFPPNIVTFNVTLPSSGVHILKATVTGKNAASTGYAVVFEYVSMTKLAN